MKTMKKYEYAGFFVIIAISTAFTLLFFYGNTNHFIIDWFLPVNTSLWEFAKLMFTSILIYTIIEYFAFGHEFKNFFFAKAGTLFLAPIIFVLGSYLLDYVIGTVYTTTHLLMFMTAIGLGQYISYLFFESGYYFKLMNEYAVIGTILMITMLLSQIYQTASLDGAIFKPMKLYQERILFKR